MKPVLISIRPEWVKKILDGEKTVEVRKTAPKLKPPFKCYIYCTYGTGLIEHGDEILPGMLLEEKVKKGASYGNCCNGKVVAEFACRKVLSTCGWRLTGDTGRCAPTKESEKLLPQLSCLTLDELLEYAGEPTRILYGWYISDLKIYDKPKMLSDFGLKRPPQSWCYVVGMEERGGENAAD